MSLSELFVTTLYNYSNKTDHGQGTVVASVLFSHTHKAWCFLLSKRMLLPNDNLNVKGRLQNNDNRFKLFKDFFDDQFSFLATYVLILLSISSSLR